MFRRLSPALLVAIGLTTLLAPGASGYGEPGPGTRLAGCPVLPASNSWNRDISMARVHPLSSRYIASIGRGSMLHPDFGYWVSLTEAFRRRAIDAGYTATLAAAPALRALHAA